MLNIVVVWQVDQGLHFLGGEVVLLLLVKQGTLAAPEPWIIGNIVEKRSKLNH